MREGRVIGIARRGRQALLNVEDPRHEWFAIRVKEQGKKSNRRVKIALEDWVEVQGAAVRWTAANRLHPQELECLEGVH